MKRLGLILAAIALAPAAAFAAGSSDLGGAFSEIGAGARPLGMGDAFVAVADDANAADENPAGMAFFAPDKHYATFTHSDLYGLSFLNRDYVAYAQGDQGYGAIGLSWNQLSADLQPGSWNEDAFQYSGAKQVWGFHKDDFVKLSVGWQLKYLRVATDLGNATSATGIDNGATGPATLTTSVSGGNANGWGTGLGALLKLGDQFAVGLMAQDLYSTLTWGTGTQETIPEVTRLGVSYRPDAFTVIAAEARGQEVGSGFGASSYHAGVERLLLDGRHLHWGVVRNVALRAGYYQIIYNGDGGVFTGGATVQADRWAVDYTYEYDVNGGLGDTQRFGLDLAF